MSLKPLPEDIDAERMLLATLAAPGAERLAASLLGSIHSDCFVHPAHKAIWEALRALIEEGTEVNALMIRDAVEARGKLERVGGYGGIVEILSADEVGRPEVLVRILQTHRQRRAAYGVAANLGRLAQDRTGDIHAAIADAGLQLARIVQSSEAGGLAAVSTFSSGVLERMVDRINGKKNRGTAFHGFDQWNALTGGLQPGQLVILAARPGVGKTALALTWALAAAENGNAVAIFSLEMSRQEVADRLLVKKVGMPCREGQVEALGPLARAREDLDRLPLHISDQATITVPEVIAQVDGFIARQGRVGLVVLDYLQLLSSPEGKGRMTEAVRIGEISRALKLLAKDRGVPVLVLSQLNREVEHRSNGRPVLSDLRDSGCLEQDADLVVFLARDMKPDSNRRSQTDLIVAKHRSGPLGVIALDFKEELCRYRECDRATAGIRNSEARREDWL